MELAGPTVLIKKRHFDSGQSYKAVLLDVDSKDPTLGMSCPPVQFLEQEVLDTIKACIRENGITKLKTLPLFIGCCLTKTCYCRYICSQFGVT